MRISDVELRIEEIKRRGVRSRGSSNQLVARPEAVRDHPDLSDLTLLHAGEPHAAERRLAVERTRSPRQRGSHDRS
jgi:hypothetical protein